jgi:hypothetical protein
MSAKSIDQSGKLYTVQDGKPYRSARRLSSIDTVVPLSRPADPKEAIPDRRAEAVLQERPE